MSIRLPDPNPFDKKTPAQRIHMNYAVDALNKAEEDVLYTLINHHNLPRDWQDIWEDEDRRDPKRIRVTARLDADVVKFFKAMGEGYQHRMNRVLRAYMHLRLSKMVNGPDTSDFVLRPEEVMRKARKRTEWGDTDRLFQSVKEPEPVSSPAKTAPRHPLRFEP